MEADTKLYHAGRVDNIKIYLFPLSWREKSDFHQPLQRDCWFSPSWPVCRLLGRLIACFSCQLTWLVLLCRTTCWPFDPFAQASWACAVVMIRKFTQARLHSYSTLQPHPSLPSFDGHNGVCSKAPVASLRSDKLQGSTSGFQWYDQYKYMAMQ